MSEVANFLVLAWLRSSMLPKTLKPLSILKELLKETCHHSYSVSSSPGIYTTSFLYVHSRIT